LARPCPPATRALSLHDALPISGADRTGDPGTDGHRLVLVAGAGTPGRRTASGSDLRARFGLRVREPGGPAAAGCYGDSVRSRYEDRKSTRLNSSHVKISYAVFC